MLHPMLLTFWYARNPRIRFNGRGRGNAAMAELWLWHADGSRWNRQCLQPIADALHINSIRMMSHAARALSVCNILQT